MSEAQREGDVAAQSPASSRARWRKAGSVLGLLIACGAGYGIYVRTRADLPLVIERVSGADPGPVLASLLLTLVCIALGGVSWYQVLRAVGESPPLGECLRIQSISNLGGYLPGYGWKFVGKGLLSRRMASTSIVSAAVLVEFISLAASRLIVSLATLPLAFIRLLGWPAGPWVMVALRLIALSLLLTFPWVLARFMALLQRRNPTRWSLPSIHQGRLLLALMLMCLTWLIFGLGFALQVRTLDTAVSWAQLPMLLFSVTASFLVSLLTFIVPAGLTIRESVVLFTLGHLLTAPIALAAAVLGRLVLLSAELLGAAAAASWSWARSSRRAARNRSMTLKD